MNLSILNQKIVTKPSEICGLDPEKTYPGSISRGQKRNGHRIPDRQQWILIE
jgi:hypothetical protein